MTKPEQSPKLHSAGDQQQPILTADQLRISRLRTALRCRFSPVMTLLLVTLPFYGFLQALISPSEILASLFLLIFVVSVICVHVPDASATRKNFGLFELPIFLLIVLCAAYLFNTSSSQILLAKHVFWLAFSVYSYYYYAQNKRSKDIRLALTLLYFASLIAAFTLVFDNFSKLVLRNPALFDSIIYAHLESESSSLDPYHLSYRANGLLGSRALTTGFIGLGGLAGVALFWRSRLGGLVFSMHSVLLFFCFGLTAFVGFQVAFVALFILTWSRDKFSGLWVCCMFFSVVVFVIILFDLLAYPWIASNSHAPDADGMPRSVAATLMAMFVQHRNALFASAEHNVINLYSEQLRAYVSATDMGLVELLFGIGALGAGSRFVLGWDWGLLDWITRIGIVGAGAIIYMLLNSIISSAKLLRVCESSPSANDGSTVKRFVFLASVFLILTSIHYDILLKREIFPIFFFLLALSKRLGTDSLVSTKLAAQ